MTEKSEARISLESRAEELGVRFAWNTGDDTLAARVKEAEARAKNTAPETPSQENPEGSATQAVGGEGPVMAEAQEVSATNPAPVPDQAVAVLVITGPARGFRRAGRHFGPQKVTIPVDDLTPTEFERLVNEPALTVVKTEVPASI
ncbi:hypothetical protein [Chachezhania antarctica]|uniref:hypothetical protein n=1 Tax=Chachezhania antarctica TaxID=2340860 RepID=UPI000EAF93AC|nr:hypothetical protein [Chachezhania antarctica]